jgi:hypothetical protein
MCLILDLEIFKVNDKCFHTKQWLFLDMWNILKWYIPCIGYINTTASEIFDLHCYY